jgi:uncharacterized membrane-anchored protein
MQDSVGMSGNVEDKSSGWFDLSSKFWRTVLVIAAALLVFAGPTYVPYLLANHLNVNYAASVILGLILFLVGLGLVWYLARKKVIM